MAEDLHIKELYIEPTSRCNLACAMCSRNHWVNESTGDLDWALFEKAMGEIPASVNRVFFGGVGEPLVHPRILDMIGAVKRRGLRCELITNGTLLDDEMCRSLLALKLDKLWVSLDSLDDTGESPGHQSGILQNIARFVALREPVPYVTRSTRLCIMFVLMKSNQRQLEKLIDMTEELGIDEIKVTHLLPYDPAMEKEICYGTLFPLFGYGGTTIDMPFIEAQGTDSKALRDLMLQGRHQNTRLMSPTKSEYCRFVQEGVVFLRWDGEMCPCMPLLHDNTVYQSGHRRKLRHCSFGNLRELPLDEIWNSGDYGAFRERVRTFDFSPCVTCGACGLFETNDEDCVGSPFPACGHCLWAYGLIQCP